MSALSVPLAARRTGRIHGLDLARGLAVIGMVVVNLTLGVSPMAPTFIYILGAGAMAGAAILLSIDAAEAWPRATAPLRAMGRQALTLYVGHAVLLVLPAASWVEAGRGLPPAVVLGLGAAWVVAAAVFVRAWFTRRDRGPVEALMRWAMTRR